MTTTSLHTGFQPPTGLRALARQVYQLKFSVAIPLVFVLLSMLWTVYRTQHYLIGEFHINSLVAWPTAIAIELLVLSASAGTFMALRAGYIAELKNEDKRRAWVSLSIALVMLVVSFVALLGVAAADAWLMTMDVVPAALMTLIQAAQALLIVWFITHADMEEREQLRIEYAAYRSGTCRYCHQPVTPNNRARHEASCVMRPKEQP